MRVPVWASIRRFFQSFHFLDIAGVSEYNKDRLCGADGNSRCPESKPLMEEYRSGHNGLDSKSSNPVKGTVGSNPTSSAIKKARKRNDFLLFYCLGTAVYPSNYPYQLYFVTELMNASIFTALSRCIRSDT